MRSGKESGVSFESAPYAVAKEKSIIASRKTSLNFIKIFSFLIIYFFLLAEYHYARVM